MRGGRAAAQAGEDDGGEDEGQEQGALCVGSLYRDLLAIKNVPCECWRNLTVSPSAVLVFRSPAPSRCLCQPSSHVALSSSIFPLFSPVKSAADAEQQVRAALVSLPDPLQPTTQPPKRIFSFSPRLGTAPLQSLVSSDLDSPASSRRCIATFPFPHFRVPFPLSSISSVLRHHPRQVYIFCALSSQTG